MVIAETYPMCHMFYSCEKSILRKIPVFYYPEMRLCYNILLPNFRSFHCQAVALGEFKNWKISNILLQERSQSLARGACRLQEVRNITI